MIGDDGIWRNVLRHEYQGAFRRQRGRLAADAAVARAESAAAYAEEVGRKIDNASVDLSDEAVARRLAAALDAEVRKQEEQLRRIEKREAAQAKRGASKLGERIRTLRRRVSSLQGRLPAAAEPRVGADPFPAS